MSLRFSRCYLSLFCALLLGLSSCSIVPVTKRKGLKLVSDLKIRSQSQTEYNAFVARAREKGLIVEDPRVKEIAQRMMRATESYLCRESKQSIVSMLDWEFNLVWDYQINAFCMPGGKIAVYTGLVSLLGEPSERSDAELAAVIGHEIAHAIANHGNEIISKAKLRRFRNDLLSLLFMGETGDRVEDLAFDFLRLAIWSLYSIGEEYFGTLRFLRKQEYEADKIGLALMAMAGYNPKHALTLWEKMHLTQAEKQVAFFSTHPQHKSRIKSLLHFLPTAQEFFTGEEIFAPAEQAKKRTRSTVPRRASEVDKFPKR